MADTRLSLCRPQVTGEQGIIPRALSHIFGHLHQQTEAGSGGVQYSVTMSFLQI